MTRRLVPLSLLLAFVLAAALLVPMAASAKKKHADTVFKNGYIYTVNPCQRVAKAVAVHDGKIMLRRPQPGRQGLHRRPTPRSSICTAR